MIKIPDPPFNSCSTGVVKKNYREVFDLLTATVQSTLSHDESLYANARQGLISWKRKSGRLYFFFLYNYTVTTFRLETRSSVEHILPVRFWPAVKVIRGCLGRGTKEARDLSDHHYVEMSFVEEDLPEVATPALVRFVESVFDAPDEEDVWRWPLFAYPGQSFPHYAWSKAGLAKYEGRRKLWDEWNAARPHSQQPRTAILTPPEAR